jgi:hypothetical protein
MLGTEITEEDLVPVMERFLKDNMSDIKLAALRNLHIFLSVVYSDTRERFISYIVQTNDDA